MVSPPCCRCLLVLALLPGALSPAIGQENGTSEGPEDERLGDFVGVGVVPKLTIARKDIPAYLTDEGILAAHDKNVESGGRPTLEGVFSVGADSSRYAFFWDPVSCRLLGAVDLDPPSPAEPVKSGAGPGDEADSGDGSPPPTGGQEGSSDEPVSRFFLTASGPAPLSETAGASGAPSFFGVRLVEGKPEFLYEQGTLLVEERLWLENGGETLQQLFTFREMDSPLSLRVPEDWKDRITADRGDWKENSLSVPPGEAGELRLTYRLGPETPEPGEEEEE